MAMAYRKWPDGRRVTVRETHLLSALRRGQWLTLDDIWRQATLPVGHAEPILTRLVTHELAERGVGLRGPAFRFTPAGHRFYDSQLHLPLATWPWGLDLRLARRTRRWRPVRR